MTDNIGRWNAARGAAVTEDWLSEVGAPDETPPPTPPPLTIACLRDQIRTVRAEWLAETAGQFDVLVSGWALEYLWDRARAIWDRLSPDTPPPPALTTAGTKEEALAVTDGLLAWCNQADTKPPESPRGKQKQPAKRGWIKAELEKAIQAEVEKYASALASARHGSRAARQALRKTFRSQRPCQTLGGEVSEDGWQHHGMGAIGR